VNRFCEQLEPRLLCYAIDGARWASANLTYSFPPDGTVLDNGTTSVLFARMDARYSRATWQHEFARALNTWAQAGASVNFRLVSDDGSPRGTIGLAQGDSRFGDIRIGMGPTDAIAYTWYPTANSTIGGDVTLSSTSAHWNIGTVDDLYTDSLHEFGHALGLAHSSDLTAVMSGAVASRVVTGLAPDDIAGIRYLYPPVVVQPPAPPSAVTATCIGDKKHPAIRVTWLSDDPVEVQRWDGKAWVSVVLNDGVDAPLVHGTTYVYRMRAVANGLASAWVTSKAVKV
jgi:hypothetical protein